MPRNALLGGLPPLHVMPAIPQPPRWFFGRCAHQLDHRLQRRVRTLSDVSYLSLQWAAYKVRLLEEGVSPCQTVKPSDMGHLELADDQELGFVGGHGELEGEAGRSA